MKVAVKWLPGSDGLAIPAYATPGSAGLDLPACVGEPGVRLFPGERKLIPCGLAVELPPGFEAQVRSRSGLALKNGVMVLNSPGTIDSDYRGPIAVILYNTGAEVFLITRGMRIAQMVIAPVVQAEIEVAEMLSDTARGQGGFGSTGVKESQ